MTVPGVNPICAASFIAAIGDPYRFMTSRKLIAYLGLDPRVKQSGEGPARSGRISKRGSPSARWAPVEAAWTAVLHPGPLHAFYQRTRIRRGHGNAIVATARKLAVLFWCMLTQNEDYAHQQPSLTRKKLRQLQLNCRSAQIHPPRRRYLGHQRPHTPSRAGARPPSRDLIQAHTPRPKAGAPANKAGASVTPERA